MHPNPGVVIGCTDCHGGNAGVKAPVGLAYADTAYRQSMRRRTSCRSTRDVARAGERQPGADLHALNRESLEFIRFVNPSDYRVAARPAAPATCR
jgi:hypothetical protein